MAKSTPGPWTANDTHPGKACFYINGKSSKGYAVEVAVVYRGDDEFPSEANAQLIAAAPELLEALKQVAKWCHSGHGHFPASGCGLCKPILEVIAKAEGSN